MGKAKFILKEPNSKNDTLIYLVFHYQYKRFKFSTREKINPKLWNEKKQRVKESRNFPSYPEFNARLDNFEHALNNTYRKLLNDEVQPTNELLKQELELLLSGKILSKRKKSFFEFIKTFISESELTKKTSTVTVYRTTFKHLENYASSKRKNIDFNNINLSFYSEFTKYLSQDLEMSTNTIGKYIKTIKTFLNEATERGLNTNLEFRKSKFKTVQEESDSVYLSIEELKIIDTYDLSNNARLEKVKDLFLLGCYTGLRFSDFSQIKEENINESRSIIQVRTQKTNERVAIPMNPVVKKILKKYNQQAPESYTNQIMNRYLKELLELCEINTPTEITITKQGKTTKQILPKYKLISTHTARRSFATNCYLADIPSISIMKITGHKTEKSFLKYIKVTQEQNADKLLNHPFFN